MGVYRGKVLYLRGEVLLAGESAAPILGTSRKRFLISFQPQPALIPCPSKSRKYTKSAPF